METDGYDLRALFRGTGGSLGERALGQEPPVRSDSGADIELLDPGPSEVVATAVEATGFSDGIQNARTVTYRQHRPVYLTYAAAGAVDPDGKLLRAEEMLAVIVAREDREWVEATGSNIPIVELEETAPDLIPAAATELLRSARERMEATVAGIGTDPERPLLVDGSVRIAAGRHGCVGVVKTTATRYLSDERSLHQLPHGWRSARFRIPAGHHGYRHDVYSCYVRIADATHRAWNHGLVRLEAHDVEQLEPVAALAAGEAQGPLSGDSRYDRHLAGVRMVETTLRAKRPDIFGL